MFGGHLIQLKMVNRKQSIPTLQLLNGYHKALIQFNIKVEFLETLIPNCQLYNTYLYCQYSKGWISIVIFTSFEVIGYCTRSARIEHIDWCALIVPRLDAQENLCNIQVGHSQFRWPLSEFGGQFLFKMATYSGHFWKLSGHHKVATILRSGHWLVATSKLGGLCRKGGQVATISI